MAELRENKAKSKLRRGEVASLVTGSMTPDLIEVLGQLGFDAVMIESEHGPVDFGDITQMTRACDLWGVTSVVRFHVNLPGVIYRTLDVGALGVMVPHINTAEEAKAVVDAAKFAPIGARGIYGGRQGYGVEDFTAKANDQTLVAVMIEDIVAVDNLPEIVQVDDIDIFYVAPGDLAQSMGHVGQVGHPEVQETIDRAIQQITGAGRVAGTVVTDSTVEEAIEKGVRFLGINWPVWLTAGAKGYLQKVARAARP